MTSSHLIDAEQLLADQLAPARPEVTTTLIHFRRRRRPTPVQSR
ncbi:hypothetical protein, partial [Mycobacterium tuberculosis]